MSTTLLISDLVASLWRGDAPPRLILHTLVDEERTGEDTMKLLHEPTHVNTLTDVELDTLLDIHLFGHSRLCYGEFTAHYPTTKPSEYRCNQCAAVFEYGIAERLFGVGTHKRVVPHYTIEQIGAQMKKQTHITQLRTALAIRVALSESSGYSRSITAEFVYLLTHLTARLLAIGVLHALGLVDAEGYFHAHPDVRLP